MTARISVGSGMPRGINLGSSVASEALVRIHSETRRSSVVGDGPWLPCLPRTAAVRPYNQRRAFASAPAGHG